MKINKTLLASLAALAVASLLNAADKKHPTGYTDTPLLPDGKWRVHDDNRPRPSVVKSGETFSHLAPPPSDATVLFDGTNLDNWVNTKPNKPVAWKVENGYMEVTPKSGTIKTKESFGDFQLHLEFATPAEVKGVSQGRGNSGVIIYGSYEVQLLDSFNNKSYADGQCGAMYGQFPPLWNAAKKPGTWQTYDIIFETARWKDGKLVKKANVTVLHNGVLLHHRRQLRKATRPGRPYRSSGPRQPHAFPQHLDPQHRQLRRQR
jgi:hypothetical protein